MEKCISLCYELHTAPEDRPDSAEGNHTELKKGKAAKGNDVYVVEEGMGMREISQMFAVRLKKLYRMNNVKDGYVPQIGEEVRLR